MKGYRNKNQLLMIALGVGFLLGILYENVIAKSMGNSARIFQTYFLEQYAQSKVIAEEYLIYVAKIRLLPFLWLLLLGCLKWKKLLVSIVVTWTGFLVGILTVSAVIQLGIKGIVICIVGMFPHMLFYAMAYGIYLVYLFRYPTKQWNVQKTIFVVLTLFLGLILEVYLNPILVGWVV